MRSLILFSLVSVLGASVPVRQDQNGGPFSIAVDVHFAIFNVTVTDSKGRHVSGLKASDFRVFEDGRMQEIKMFNAEDVPATIGLIMDNSGSMSTKRADVNRAALGFVRESNPDDELFLVSFNEKVTMGLPRGVPFTSNPGQFRSALLQTMPGGMTALYDALFAGLEHLKTGRRDRKALVVLSDGGDNASRRKLDDVLQLAKRSSATIYTIGIYDDTDPDKNPRVLRKIAESSGGRSYFPENPASTEQVWRDIAAEIRNQYTIGYIPGLQNRSGQFRSVKVMAKRNGGALRITTRDGYIVPEVPSVAR